MKISSRGNKSEKNRNKFSLRTFKINPEITISPGNSGNWFYCKRPFTSWLSYFSINHLDCHLTNFHNYIDYFTPPRALNENHAKKMILLRRFEYKLQMETLQLCFPPYYKVNEANIVLRNKWPHYLPHLHTTRMRHVRWRFCHPCANISSCVCTQFLFPKKFEKTLVIKSRVCTLYGLTKATQQTEPAIPP